MSLENYPSSRNDPMDAHHDQHDEPTKYPVHRYDFEENAFTNEQRAWIGEGFARMSALGPTAVRFVDGTAKILVRHWPDVERVTTKDAGLTTWLPGGRIQIWFDPVGLHGSEAWIDGAAHEMGHVFNGNTAHVPAEFPAIMNETIAEMEFDASLGEAQPMGNTLSGNPPPRAPTTADFELFDKSRGL